MESQRIRRGFLEYFKKNRHTVIPSSSVVPREDPSLLFVNAGMNQFKDLFLGKTKSEYLRAVSSQKCIRVGGKHNDLENVGHTSRHLTFFEMLGNFSFGDYFKKEAIAFAWEVTLNLFRFPPERIWATVFHRDEESFDLWKAYLPEERIIRMGEKDNFWSMGDIGPCGPCSELLFDRGSTFGTARHPAEDISGERYLEFWNLVFMEFNRTPSGDLIPLPKKCVDTGSGLERVVSLIMGVKSVFETDILASLIHETEKLVGKKYSPQAPTAPAFHVIADHLRTLAFAIADGVQPSNIERGYVLRKVLRRALRYGRQLGIDRPFLADLLPKLTALMGDDFPELRMMQEGIGEILTLEEEAFLKTLRRGGNILNQIVAQSEKTKEISGEDAFKLKDTYGLPLEEIILLAKDSGLVVDVRRFEELEKEAKERSRVARKESETAIDFSAFEGQESPFLGYQQFTTEAVVIGLLKDGTKVDSLIEGEQGCILLDQTPFYAEKGGQVGDQGVIATEDSSFEVIDCQAPLTNLVAHMGIVQKGAIHVGDLVTATIDVQRRQKIANNHTATHLLHWALKQVLGNKIKQAGSIVEPYRFRFDFTYPKALTGEEIQVIEKLVNEKIRENRGVEIYELSFDEAQKRKDIVQFFEEKYGSRVRVVDIDFSKELCGGTHTKALGAIGYFRILKEGGIASGIRRIEAVTGEEAEQMIYTKETLLTSLSELLKSPEGQLKERIERLVQENKKLSSRLETKQKELLGLEVDKLSHQVEKTGSLSFLAAALDLNSEELAHLADLIMEKHSTLVLFLIGKQPEGCSLIARVSSDLVAKGIKAVDLIKEIAPVVGGKGGGKSDAAQGAAKEVAKIPNALNQARAWIKAKSV